MSDLFGNLTSAADEFFHGGVLQLSEGLHEMGSLKWQLVIALFFAWLVVFGVIVKGEFLETRIPHMSTRNGSRAAGPC